MSITKVNSKIHKLVSYNETISNPTYDRHQREIIEEELQNLENYQTQEYKELPSGRKAIGSKQIFKVKYLLDRSVTRFKVRLVAQKFSQVQGINFSEMFAPTMRRESSQIYLTLCIMLNLIIHQVDIVSAYLKNLLGDNKLPIFMKLPPGMHNLRQI